MNFYNPYSVYPYMNAATTTARTGGLFSRLFGSNITFSSILNGTQKVLNITNQALPLVKQAGPIFKNAKTMFKVMNEFNRTDAPKSTNTIIPTKVDTPTQTKKVIEIEQPTQNTNISNNNLTFFQ